MKDKLGQAPAFPIVLEGEFNNGISTRLYLAGMAMQGILANPNENLLTKLLYAIL